MKKSFSIIKFLFALLAITVFSVGVSAATGFSPLIVGGISAALSFIPSGASGIVAYAGLNQEIWTDVLVDTFNRAEEGTFLNEIPDESRHVVASKNDNDIIHLVDVGADPEVLLNNTAYPIPIVSQTDADIPIQLDKFQTKATAVSDDEIQHIAYDKIALVQRKHSRAIVKIKVKKAAHALSPSGHTAATPVLVTTGADDGTGRKKLTKADLIKFKRAIDDWKDQDGESLPEEGRVLVLCPEHYNDLLEDPDTKNLFANQNQNESSGKLNQMIAGFKIYWYGNNPYYTAATKVKLSYGAVPAAGDYQASFYFIGDDMFKATGRTKNYTDEPDTQYQAWRYNVRHNFIALPKKLRSIGAIVSAAVA